MKMNIKSNAPELQSRIDDLVKQQMPFATSLALNKSMKNARDIDLKIAYDRFFDKKNKTWFQQVHQIRNSKVAHIKKTGVAVAAIQRSSLPSPPGTKINRAKRAAFSDFMERHVRGGAKTPVSSRSIAVPISDNVRRRKGGSKAGAVVQSQKPKTIMSSGKGFVFEKQGKKFMAQKFGRGAKQTRVLYSLRKSVNIKGGYNPEKAVKQGLRKYWNVNFKHAMVRALQTAKLR